MELESFDMEKGEGKRIPSAGRCIYCGDDQSDLTDEHVIPYALGGNTVIFEKACCIPCQRLIQPYEQRFLRGQLGVYRTRIDAPTRRRRDRPTHKRLHFIEVDDRGQYLRDLCTREFPVADTPLAFSVWDLAPPRILGEGASEAQHIGRPWTYVQRELAMKLAAEVGQETKAKHVAVRVDEINRADFLRFLAKMAHAFAVSEQGVDAFKPLATSLILGKSDDLAQFVGGDSGPNPHEKDPANMVELTIGKIIDGPVSGHTAVRIRLYPLLGTPAHVVVVGAPN